MKKLIFLVYLAAFLAASGAVSAQQGTIGSIELPPSEQEEATQTPTQIHLPPAASEPQPKITPPPRVRVQPSVTPPPAAGVLRGATLDGRRPAIKYDRNGRVVSVGAIVKKVTKKDPNLGKKRHRALWAEAHKAGVVSRSFVEARDAQTLGFAADYTDSVIAKASKKAWLAIVLSIISIIIGLAAWRRRPQWRPVHY